MDLKHGIILIHTNVREIKVSHDVKHLYIFLIFDALIFI